MTLKPRAMIDKMAPADVPTAGRFDKLRLDYCEWPGPVPPMVHDALTQITPVQLAAYPEYDAFHRDLAHFLGLVDANNILTFNGSDEAIALIVRAYLESGDRAAVVRPTFGQIPHILSQHGVTPVEVPLHRALAQGGPVYAFDFDGLTAALHAGARALIVPSPNNPTGTWAEPSYWLDIAEAFPDCLILIDEAYAEFAPVRLHAYKACELPNLIVTGTFSKALGLAGLRLGWASGHADTMRVLAKLRTPYPVNAVAMHVAGALMRVPHVVDDRILQTLDGLRHLESGLRALGIPCSRGHGNALLAWAGIDADWVTGWLGDRGILVRNLSHGDMLDGAVRITAGPTDLMDRVLDEVRAALQDRQFVVADPKRTMLATALRSSLIGRRYTVVPPTGARLLMKPAGSSASDSLSSLASVSLGSFEPPEVWPHSSPTNLASRSQDSVRAAASARAAPIGNHNGASPGGVAMPAGDAAPSPPSASSTSRGYWLSSRASDIAAGKALGFQPIGLVERETDATLREAGAIATVPARHGEHGVADIVDLLLALFSYHAPFDE